MTYKKALEPSSPSKSKNSLGCLTTHLRPQSRLHPPGLIYKEVNIKNRSNFIFLDSNHMHIILNNLFFNFQKRKFKKILKGASFRGFHVKPHFAHWSANNKKSRLSTASGYLSKHDRELETVLSRDFLLLFSKLHLALEHDRCQGRFVYVVRLIGIPVTLVTFDNFDFYERFLGFF